MTTDTHFRGACLPANATVRDALATIDGFASAVALIVDDKGLLVGVLTDGDIRRGLLRGVPLEASALPLATLDPLVCPAGTPRSKVLDLMTARSVSAVPEVDSAGRLVGLHTLSGILGGQALPNIAVVMAGGKGTRLGDATKRIPKPLMPVAGRSILEWIVLNLVGGGIRTIYLSVNHLADQIEQVFGDGSDFGCSIKYLREQPELPLGTAGSLAMLDRENLVDPVLVMNGDLMSQFNVRDLIGRHVDERAAVTVAVRSYEHEVPFGVVTSDGAGHVQDITEKPQLAVDINTGVYVVSPEALLSVPTGRASTMPELIQTCIERGDKVASWRLSSDWVDVGTPGDLARARGWA